MASDFDQEVATIERVTSGAPRAARRRRTPCPIRLVADEHDRPRGTSQHPSISTNVDRDR